MKKLPKLLIKQIKSPKKNQWKQYLMSKHTTHFTGFYF